METHLDFAGKATETSTRHRMNSSVPELTTQKFFTYAPQGQIISHIHIVGSSAPQQLSVPQYDDLGQLIQKNVGGLVGGAPLQRVHYRYNIRGWLEKINNPNQALTDDLFAFEIRYDNKEFTTSTALFNGNIAEIHWRTKSDNKKRSYSFDYDALNRLKNAQYKTNHALVSNPNAFENFDEALNYDKNGNITDLHRKGLVHDNNTMDVIDDLDYQYMPFTQADLCTPKRKPQRFCKILILRLKGRWLLQNNLIDILSFQSKAWI